MNTWPISRTTRDRWTYVGIPDRFGTGGLSKSRETFPTLEEVAGDDWSAAVLRAILPSDRTWAWGTRSDFYRSSKLPTTSAPDEVNPAVLDQVVARRMRLDGMTLAFVPAGDSASQDTVARWSGADVEQIPDHIWTGPDTDRWSTDAIVVWCRDADQWSNPATAPKRSGAEACRLRASFARTQNPRAGAAIIRRP